MTFEYDDQPRRLSSFERTGRRVDLHQMSYKTRYKTRKIQPTTEDKLRAERLRRLDEVIKDGRIEVVRSTDKHQNQDTALALKIETVESLYVDPEPSTSSLGQLELEVDRLNIKQEPEEDLHEC